MNTITLRTLLREPLRVKRITGAGKTVQVTDKGQPLWIIHPAENEEGEAQRQRAIDEVLDEVLLEKPSKVSAAKLLEDSRR